MARDDSSVTTTVRAASDLMPAIDAMAAATNRSRNAIVDQALRQYVDVNVWRTKRIEAGMDAAAEGQIRPAADVFVKIAAKHGWEP